MRAPAFWWGPRHPFAQLLRPLGALYGAIAARRMQREGARCGAPVVCVGNFVVGGAGKTPTAIAVAHHLAAMGHRPAFVSRGYGGASQATPVRVEPNADAARVGDEPLLLARHAPTFVCRDRLAAARAAVLAGASVVIMDDGLQNPTLHKDLTIAVVDAAVGVGNGLCLPAGPLRAPLAVQMTRCDALVVIGPQEGWRAVGSAAGTRPTLRAAIVPDAASVAGLEGQRVFAFAGIGRPEKFFATLETLGARLVGRRSFDDHHPYRTDEIAALRRAAKAEAAHLITTEKDFVRMADRDGISVLPVHLSFDAPEALGAVLSRFPRPERRSPSP